MSIPPSNDRRDFTVAAITPGPDEGEPHFTGSTIELPIILVAALAAAETSLAAFISRLSKGSIWQDGAIRSADRTVVIQAYLAPDGLRGVVQIGKSAWYHHPLDTLHLFGVMLPAATMVVRDVPLTSVLRHPLLDPLQIGVSTIRELNTARPDLGVSMRLVVPTITVNRTTSGKKGDSFDDGASD